MSTSFYMPALNVMGSGCLVEAINYIKDQGFKQGLIVSDSVLNKIGVVKKFTDLLDKEQISSVVFDQVHPNPTVQ